jgi:hydrogenase maturation protein HypF
VYKLAQSFELTGYVFNSSSGVTIEVEGSEFAIYEFMRELGHNPPSLAQVTDVTEVAMELLGGSGFSILQSSEETGEFGLVPADAGTCDACWREFCDPLNRRYAYPFTNCTHCGPRYTIIRNIPYDRASTTMASFTMCSDCQAEYDDPADQRFHAHPNACAVCGPSLGSSSYQFWKKYFRSTRRVLIPRGQFNTEGDIVLLCAHKAHRVKRSARSSQEKAGLRYVPLFVL